MGALATLIAQADMSGVPISVMMLEGNDARHEKYSLQLQKQAGRYLGLWNSTRICDVWDL